MKICDVVLNSIWYDPRVRKQIAEYIRNGLDISCVGIKCERYDSKKVSELPCKVDIVSIQERYNGYQRSVFRKLIREHMWNKAVTDAIIAQKPDLIHANDLNALIPAYKAAKKLKCRLIYDSHEVFVENLNIKKNKLYSCFLKIQEKYIVKRIDKMICVSNAAAEYFAKIYNIEKPMVVTNCSLASENCISEEKNSGFEVLNHGRFYSGRGYDIMAEATALLKAFPQIKLAVRGYGALEEQLRKRVKELKADNFIFYPPVVVEKLIESASRSMVGIAITEPICLNFKLSVSNKLFEYAAAGLPVIMSDIPEHRYLNEKYNFGVIIPENTPEALAKAILKLYEDKDFYNKCAENAKVMAEEINWENEFGKLIDAEEGLLGGNKQNV